jgi:hypothetical protein
MRRLLSLIQYTIILLNLGLANKASNRHGYQYYLNDLPPEQTYDINVKAIAGYKRTDPDSQHIFSMSDSPMSNTLPVSAPAAPKSPKLMLEGLHPEGIDVSWQVPQQFGDINIICLFWRKVIQIILVAMTITGFVSSDLSIPFSININSEKNY